MNLTNISRPYLGINKMKIDLTTGTWQDNPGCPINITLVSTSDVSFTYGASTRGHGEKWRH